jgi:hypothetical protein
MIYIAAFIGTVVFIAIQLKIEKQKADSNPKYHLKWKNYFQKEWDDFAFSLIVGQCLAFFQESIFYGYASWADWSDDKAIDFYVESEIAIAGCMGLFGSLLIMIVFKYIIKKASKISDS